ncbi:MAG: hypothetical protein M3O77_00920, partial [Chloroflexota bacterium]|nr:hypothetical protein [Chloroflexota bacterium]
MTSLVRTDRDDRVRAALYRARILANRTPHFMPQTRGEANRALDVLERQLGLNRTSPAEASWAIELLMRAHPSIAFGLLRDVDFVERFAGALRHLGLRGIVDRLDEVPGSIMALPISGPTGARRHRDELPSAERIDADGEPLPPPPGYY